MGAFKGKYASVDQAHCLDMNKIVSKVKKDIKTKFPEISTEKLHETIGLNLAAINIGGQTFGFENIPNKFGGFRWMIQCPKCGKRSLKLYLPQSIQGREQKYFCKKCHDLRPPSSLYGSTKRYKEIVKPMRRMERIKELLSSNPSSKKAESLIDEYESLEQVVKGSTFYKRMVLLEKDSPLK